MRVHAEGKAPDAQLALSMDNDVATRAWNPHDDVDPQSCSDKTHDIEFYVSPVSQEDRTKKTLEVVEIGAVIDVFAEVKPALRTRCPIKRQRVRLPFGPADCCLKSATERARPDVTWSTSTSATHALRRRMCALGCSHLVACTSREQGSDA